MTHTSKKPWAKPQLIVLIRMTESEAVLVGCKVFDEGPSVVHCGCDQTETCQNCVDALDS